MCRFIFIHCSKQHEIHHIESNHNMRSKLLIKQHWEFTSSSSQLLLLVVDVVPLHMCYIIYNIIGQQ